MYIRQQNGKGKIGYGVSVKDPNQTGKYYCYVWDRNTFNYEEVKKIRKIKGKENYSKTKGWRSIGRLWDLDTNHKLYDHLEQVYGKGFDKEEVQKHLQEEYDRLEIKRKKELTRLNTLLIQTYNQKGIDGTIAKTIREAQRKLKKLESL